MPLFVEPVEARTLLAASLSGGLLTITGTGGNDAYTVKVSGASIVVQRAGDSAQSFAASSVTRIVANLGGGNDSILIDDNVAKPATLNGEAGDDTLRGSSANDFFDGGAGNDTADYSARTAAITASLSLQIRYYDEFDYTPVGVGSGGQAGETDRYGSIETITGGSGNDTISLAGADYDPIGAATLRGNGGGGNDAFNLYSNYAYHQSTTLLAYGDAGNDSFDFGENRDPAISISMYGGAGDDSFVDNTDDGGYDLIDGGTGTDTLSVSSIIQKNYAIPAGVENFNYFGSSNVNVFGNDLANRINVSRSYFATVYGMGGDDTIIAGSGDDSIDGGAGNDTIDYSARTAAITGNLSVRFEPSPSGALPYVPVVTGSAGQDGESDSLRDVETIVGGSGDDSLSLFDANSAVYPNDGYALRVIGGDGNDALSTANTDSLSFSSSVSLYADGGRGNDRFSFNGFGSGILSGGDGDDLFQSGSDDASAVIIAGAGVDTFIENSGLSVGYTMPAGLENYSAPYAFRINVTGNDLANRITGGRSDSVVRGMGGDDTIVTGAGNDSIDAGSGNDRIDPGTGNDTVDGGSGGDALSYATSNLAVTGTLRANLVWTGSSYVVRREATTRQTEGGYTYTDTATNIEVLSGSLGNDTLTAEAGAGDWNGAGNVDRSPLILNGEAGNDTLSVKGLERKNGVAQNTPVMIANGNAGDDNVYAYFDDRDTIDGGEGNDLFAHVGNYGVANVVGGSGTDILYIKRYVGPGQSLRYFMTDTLENLTVDGPGRIDVVGNDLPNRITMTGTEGTWVRGQGGNDTIYGTDGVDALDGGSGDDVLYGLGGDDRLWGYRGRDTLYGGAGVDQLWGGDDNDRLDGGPGADSIWGEAGNDTYVRDPSDALVSGIEAYA